MHTCCAPCFTYIEDDIKNNGIKNKDGENEKVELTAFLYNPNIHPKLEYERRKDTFINFCNMKNCKYVIYDEYDLNKFVKDVVENVGENKEYNVRCEYCYYTRLNNAFEYAKENGYDIVSTTLSISPYQNHELIIKIGKKLEEKYGIEFMYKDYRPNFRQGQQMAKDLGLYRQKYCGCIFSIDSGKWEY
jgi:predicted adenine nucleotide alpha hydrolase (AANH) superfamily ATPase